MFHLYTKSAKILAQSPKLWAMIIIPILAVAFIGLLSAILIFALALKPQADVFIGLFPTSSGFTALAWILAVVLCLLESAVAVFIIQYFGLQRSSEKVFQFVYKQARPSSPHQIMNESYLEALAPITSWRLLKPTALFILSMPINAIPVVGQLIFVLLNGYFQGPAMHTSYFKMRGWSNEDIDKFIAHHRSEYWTFGIFMTSMELVPIVNLLNNFIGAGAAALLAIEMENKDNHP